MEDWRDQVREAHAKGVSKAAIVILINLIGAPERLKYLSLRAEGIPEAVVLPQDLADEDVEAFLQSLDITIDSWYRGHMIE